MLYPKIRYRKIYPLLLIALSVSRDLWAESRSLLHCQRKINRKHQCLAVDADLVHGKVAQFLSQRQRIAPSLEHAPGIVDHAILKFISQAVRQGAAHYPDVDAILIDALH